MPPPGGPPDVTAPRILAVSPESLAVGVPIGAAITVIFSEPIDRTTIERALWVAPGGAVKPKFSFSGEELTVRLGAPLPDSVTVGVLLTTLVQDRKRDATQNAVAEPYRWIFSTGDTLWKGRVTGKVERGSGAPPGGGANRGIVLVGLYPGDADTVPDPSETEPAAITQMRANGEFTLDGLPTDGRRRWLLAMFDRDGNRAFNDRGDFVSATGEPIVLTPDSSATDVFLRLVDPNSPAEAGGTLARADGDSASLWVALYEAAAESLTTPKAKVQVARAGAFTLRGVPAGAYRLVAFCDENRNSRRDPEEPWIIYEGTVELAPAEKRELGTLDAPRCRPAP